MRSSEMLDAIHSMALSGYSEEHPLRLMEVCGTHTMAIAKAGLRQLLPPHVKLISGPGCPVCVTPSGAMDAVLAFSVTPGVTLCTYGDLLRVPGTARGDNLLARRAKGASVRAVYSAMDALDIARENPAQQVVFLAVGFETTAPGTAACILAAREQGIRNFSVLSLMKTTEPAIRAILADEGCQVGGLICPGHVAAVTGSEAFAFLTQEYGLPAVVAGFEGEDVIRAVYELCAMRAQGKPGLVNAYTRVVRPQGNPIARQMLHQVFETKDDVWRGLGQIAHSGLAIRHEYAEFDAAKRFHIEGLDRDAEKANGCRCGDILRGAMEPTACPLFGRVCAPGNPVGPCMVSGEGACAAAYKYQGVV